MASRTITTLYLSDLCEARTEHELLSAELVVREVYRAIDHLAAVAVEQQVQKERLRIFDICYQLALKYGLISYANTFAIIERDLTKVQELIKICVDPTYVPKLASSRVVTEWLPTPVVAYATGGYEQAESDLQLRHLMLRQLLFMIAEAHWSLTATQLGLDEDYECQTILDWSYRARYYDHMIEEAGLRAPKSLESTCGASLEQVSKYHNAHQVAGLIYATAFTHAGYCEDAWLTKDVPYVLSLLRKTGVSAAMAGIGLMNLWQYDKGIEALENYQYSNDVYTRAGCALGFGIVFSGLRDDSDTALTLISQNLDAQAEEERACALLSLGIAYAGTRRNDLKELIAPYVLTCVPDESPMVNVMAALALGLVFMGSANTDVRDLIIELLKDTSITGSTSPVIYNASLSYALLYLSLGDQIRDAVDALSSVDQVLREFTVALLTMFGYASTENVLAAQNMLHENLKFSQLLEELQKEYATQKQNEQSKPPAAANPNETETKRTSDDSEITPPNYTDQYPVNPVMDVLLQSIAAIYYLGYFACFSGNHQHRDDLMRLALHTLHIDNDFVRRAVPLAVSLLFASDPNPLALNLLNRLSRAEDGDCVINSILSVGIVGLGTNNARCAEILKNYSNYYSRDPAVPNIVAMAQGLLHCGKGLLTANRNITSIAPTDTVRLGCLLAFIIQCLMHRNSFCDTTWHLLFYVIVPTLRPNWLITVDEKLEPVAMSVRVGNFVDSVGQPGLPSILVSHQAHQTPVVFRASETAELANGDMQSCSHQLSGICCVRPTPVDQLKKANEYMRLA